MKINIKGIDKTKLLMALFNNAIQTCPGVGVSISKKMNIKEASELLRDTCQFDYVRGKALKVDLDSAFLETKGYVRANGKEALENVIREFKG